MPWNKTDRSFKTLINKRVTDSDAKFYFNEKGDFTINTHQLELWVDVVPSTAPGATTDIVEYYNTLTLVEDTSVPSKQAWFATTNSSTAPAQTDETSRLKNWVSDKYGSTYEIVLYDTSNVQIPPSDGCGWFFDYQTGILTFSSTTTTTGPGGSLSSRAPFKIKGYRYIGRTGLDGNIIKNEVRVATTPATSFSGWSYSSELIDTGVTSATLSIDGVTLSTTEGLTGDRILIKNWSTLSNNGIYYVERAGDGASDTWRFKRAPDFNDTQDIFPGTMVFVRSGTVNARTVWSMSNASFTTLDAGGSTGEITFSQFITATTRWSALTAPDANLSLSMSTYTTTLNWATGTSTNNLFNLTTDASANGTGALLNLATGSSSTVLPLLVKVGATTALTVNASAQVLIGTLTSGRVTYAGTNGLLQDSANMTFDDNKLSLATTGNTGGLLIGSDANLYRSAADVLKTDDSFVVGVNLTVSSLTITRIPFASTSGLLVDSSSFTYTTGTGQLALATTGSGAGILIGGDAQLYRSAADTLRTPDSLTVDVNLTVSGTASIGAVGGAPGTINLLGSTSGTVSVLVQVAAGTYNFNLPTTAGSSGEVLTSAGGAGSPMTWTAPGALAVRWNSLVNPNGNESLTMGVNTTTFNWATGTSTNNLFNLTTDASANGTGALLRIATGTSSTVVPLLVVAAGTTALTVNASAQVLVDSLTSSRITYAGTSGLLTDSANMTFDGNRISLATTGNTGGLLIGGDANLYRSAADVLKTDDAFVALKYNNITITQPVTGATLTIADGSTFTVSATATVLNGTHSGTNTGDETTATIHTKTGYTQSFLLMGA